MGKASKLKNNCALVTTSWSPIAQKLVSREVEIWSAKFWADCMRGILSHDLLITEVKEREYDHNEGELDQLETKCSIWCFEKLSLESCTLLVSIMIYFCKL